ncbi:hypothetical protein ABBQ38_014707 [Trebouxia sp. C0009 RCD-2024]
MRGSSDQEWQPPDYYAELHVMKSSKRTSSTPRCFCSMQYLPTSTDIQNRHNLTHDDRTMKAMAARQSGAATAALTVQQSFVFQHPLMHLRLACQRLHLHRLLTTVWSSPLLLPTREQAAKSMSTLSVVKQFRICCCNRLTADEGKKTELIARLQDLDAADNCPSKAAKIPTGQNHKQSSRGRLLKPKLKEQHACANPKTLQRHETANMSVMSSSAV